MDSSPTQKIHRVINNKKVTHAIAVLIVVFIIIFIIGIIGYKHFFHMSIEDAIFNTSLTISNLGIGLHERTAGEKIFTAIFSILAGIFFISLISSIVAYVFTMYLES